MKFSKAFLFLVLCAISFAAQAGEKYRVTFSGTSETRNTSGQIISTPITSASVIRDCLGSTNNYVLLYELGADPNADFIEVINTLTGEVFCIPFRLFVPTVFNNFDGNFVVVVKGGVTEIRRIRYVFSQQSNHSVGSVHLTQKIWRDGLGNTNRINIAGEFQYFVLPQGTNGVKICSGTFTASQKYP